MQLPLVGQAYTSRSVAVDAQTCINLYGELIDDTVFTRTILNPTQVGKNRAVLYGTPGKHLFYGGFSDNVRCLWSNYDRLFAVHGLNLAEISSTGTLISDTAFAATDDGLPAQIISNGNQLLIIAGGLVYCDSGSGPQQCFFTGLSGVVDVGPTSTGIPGSEVTLVSGDPFPTDGTWTHSLITINGIVYTVAGTAYPNILFTVETIPAEGPVAYSHQGDPVTAVTGAYLDGYFIVQRPRGVPAGTSAADLGRQVNFSAILDGTTWSGLDFQNKEAYSDYIRGITADSEQLYLFGDETMEVWQTNPNPGATGQVFLRLPGGMARYGSISAWGSGSLDGNVYFVGGDDRGQISAYYLNGLAPQRISTYAIEAQWNAAGVGPNAICYSYLEEGHSFLIINFGTQAWGFDPSTLTWHQRAAWSGTAFAPYTTQYHAFVQEWGANGMHLTAGMGPNVFQSSVNFYDDAGGAIAWQRALPYLYNAGKRQYYGQLILEMETGAVASGAAPLVTMDYSDDRGNTFINPRTASEGTTGQTALRMFWNRNGSSRDRIFRFSGVGTSKVALIDCECEVTEGTV